MERYAYYAMRSVLTTFFVVKLHFTEAHAVSAFMYTSALAYFTPCIGGLLSDSLLGKYLTIKIFSTIYILGLSILSISAFTSSSAGMTFLGLALIGVGTGGIKPCVSSFGADQIKYRDTRTGDNQGGDKAMRSYFSAFYFSINVGALLSYILSPLFKSHLGYGVCFLVPSLMMSCALFVLVANRSSYVIITPSSDTDTSLTSTNNARAQPSSSSSSSSSSSPVALLGRIVYLSTVDLVSTTFSSLTSSFTSSTSSSSSSSSTPKSFLSRSLLRSSSITPTQVSSASDFFRTTPFVILMPFFWMLFDQQGSAWVLQARRMDLPTWIQPEQLGVVNTAFVLAVLPVLEQYVYPEIERRGVKVTSLRRMGLGMVLAGVAFLASALVEITILSRPENSVPVAMQIPQYLILTLAEVGVSTTGLEFFYQEAPSNLKTASASLFLLTTAVGDVMGGVIYDVAGMAGVGNKEVLLFCGILMLGVSGAFINFSVKYEYRGEGGGGDRGEDDGEVELSLVRGGDEEETTGGLDMEDIKVDGGGGRRGFLD
ncbi:hypothetical protein TrCOL_g3163 [Triparma columacea]|nr:hypothetical protein TrCOL_g3163 [Triparma columacea]